MLQNVELPSEGPAPLLSLSQLMRQNPKDLIRDLNAVSVRAYDSKDVTVERLLFAPGSRELHGSTHIAQFGAFAARDLPACAIWHFTLVEQYPQQKRLRARWVSVSLILKSS